MKLFGVKFSRSAVVLGLGILGLGVGCTNADQMFGNTFVPPSQKLETYIDSSMTVKTSAISIDSVATSGTAGVYLGGYYSELFGNFHANAASTFFPEGFEEVDTLFGKNPTLDSMKISLDFNGVVGDTSFKMHISIHQLRDTMLKPYLDYFSTFDMEPYYDKTPIADFVLSGGEEGDSTVVLHLPETFYSQFLKNDTEDKNNPYLNDSIFIDTFKGLYFKLNNDPVGAEQGAIRQLSLSSSTMSLYYHNEAHGKYMADTTVQKYYFFNSYVYGGNNFSTFKHDYSTANVDAGGVRVEEIGTGIETERCLIQSMSGLGTQVELDTLFIERLKQSAKDQGFSSIALHRASLNWGLEARTPGNDISLETINRATSQLGLWYSYEKGNPVPDYDPEMEELSTSYYSDLAGYLNRSNMTYEQVITSTLQKLINKPDDIPYSLYENFSYIVQLLPCWGEVLHYNETAVGGSLSADNAPTMVVVYTLVK